MGTYQPSEKTLQRKWFVVDAEGQTLGRMATRIATILQGKHRPTWVPHFDTGDNVIVINCAKVRMTGKKLQERVYQRYSGYASGRKVTPVSQVFAKNPERVVYMAVKRMVPYTRVGRQMIRKLHVYPGSEHPHGAQKPEKLTFEKKP